MSEGICLGNVQGNVLHSAPRLINRIGSEVQLMSVFKKNFSAGFCTTAAKKWVYDDDLGGVFRGKFDLKPLTLHSCVLSESAVEEKWSFTDDLASRMWFA